MTQDVNKAQMTDESGSAVAGNQLAENGDTRNGSNRVPPKFNRHIYINLLVHVEGRIESWNRKAVRDPNPEVAHALWHKAEGLGYALRLLYAFEPEFRELVECASKGAEFGATIPTPKDHERKSL